MSRTTQEKTLETAQGPRAFTVTQLPAMRGLKLLTRLGRVLGPGIAALSTGDAAKLSGAVRDVFEKLTEDEVDHLTRELLRTATVKVQGKEIDLLPVIDSELQGEIGALLALLAFALEVNYGNFLGALAAKGAQGKAGALTSRVSSIFAGQQNG